MSGAYRHLGAFLAALALLLVFLPFLGRAAEVRAGDQPAIGADERIADDVYIAGANVTSAGFVVGDLVAAGGNVLVSAGVGADAIAAGGSISILGNVADDVRAAGGNIVVQGGNGGDFVAAAGQIAIGGSGIEGDVLVGAGTVRIDAPISGNLRIGGGDVYLNAPVAGNVQVYTEKLTLGSGARIGGDLAYTAVAEAVMKEGASVAGETEFTKRSKAVSVAGAAKAITVALLMTALAQLASALLFGLIFRRYVFALIESAVAQPLLEVGRGLVVFIVLPIVSLLLFYTVIGIPLGLFGLVSFGALLVFLWIATPIVLGSLAYRAFFGGDFEVDWKTILLGVFIYTLLGLIPIVGWFTQSLLALLTLGVASKVKWEIIKEWR